MGRLEIIFGPMFSGKTTNLLYKLSEFYDLGLSVVYINHSLDNRSKNGFSTHSSSIKNIEIPFDKRYLKTFGCESYESYESYDVIGIDEAQFFDESIISFCENMVFLKNKIIIVAGLSGSFERKKFGYILDLIPMSEKHISLHAYCKNCFISEKKAVPAYFSYRLSKNLDLIQVGDSDSYIPVCSQCYSLLSQTASQ